VATSDPMSLIIRKTTIPTVEVGLARSVVGRNELAVVRDRDDPHQWPSGLLPAHALDASPCEGVLVIDRTANATWWLRKIRERPLT
jgi:hypothetical protein